MSYNTIKEEITDLQLKTNRKLNALQESDITLEKDNNKLVKFIEDDNKTTGERTKESEQATQDRKKCEAKIKVYDTKIQNIGSEIDKNIDQLSSLEDHKKFLFGIFAKENQKWVDEVVRKRNDKLNKIKKEWIELNKLHKNKIFEDDFGGESKATESEAKTSFMGRMKGKAAAGQKDMTEKEWEGVFKQMLQDDRVDVPEDFYDEDNLFEESE